MPNGPTNPTNPTYSTNPTKPNSPTNPTNPTYSTNPTKPNGLTNPTTVCPSPSINNNFNNFNFNKASKAKEPLLVAKCLPAHHLHRYSSTQMTEKSLY